MQVPAILWDGFKKINGYLTINEKQMVFRFSDFEETSLKLELDYVNVLNLTNFKLYDQSINGLNVISNNGEVNTFILEDKATVNKILNTYSKNSK